MTWTFEFDEAKSRANEAKHGIDFVAAQRIWLDEDMLCLAARTVDEPRYLCIGVIGDKHWSAIVTNGGESVRIISVRRSRPKEVEAYEGA